MRGWSDWHGFLCGNSITYPAGDCLSDHIAPTQHCQWLLLVITGKLLDSRRSLLPEMSCSALLFTHNDILSCLLIALTREVPHFLYLSYVYVYLSSSSLISTCHLADCHNKFTSTGVKKKLIGNFEIILGLVIFSFPISAITNLSVMKVGRPIDNDWLRASIDQRMWAIEERTKVFESLCNVH